MRYLFIDTETTGPDPTRHAMVELAVKYHVHGGGTHKLRSWLMRPWEGAEISPQALEVQGVDEDELLRRPHPSIAWRHFGDYIQELGTAGGKLTLVGYNVQFDERFLNAWIQHPRGPQDSYTGTNMWMYFQWPSRCVAQVVADKLGVEWLYFPNHKLQTIADRLRVSSPPGDPHSAAYDCELAFRIWKEMQRR